MRTMRTRTLASIGLLALLPLFAMSHSDQNKENIGTFTGSLIGGIAGAALTGGYPGVIGGSMVGAYIGNRVGQNLDPLPSPANH
jgi:outer membrane lipoprotein SlyB